jgi:hypothetical protein
MPNALEGTRALISGCLFFLILFDCIAQQSGSLEISVPKANSPVVDGVLSPGEWDNATKIKVSDTYYIRAMHDGIYIYIGLSDTRQVIGSMLVDRGGRIDILHSSASLGRAEYEKSGPYWKLAKNFTWLCKQDADAVRFKAAQDKHLAEEGWLASNMNVGKHGEMEYKIAMTAASLRMAITYVTIPEGKFIQWPTTLEEDTRYVPLLTGNPPGLAAFTPERWLTFNASQ